MRDVHWCVTVFYQQMENHNIANQIHRFTIDYSKFILMNVGHNFVVGLYTVQPAGDKIKIRSSIACSWLVGSIQTSRTNICYIRINKNESVRT